MTHKRTGKATKAGSEDGSRASGAKGRGVAGSKSGASSHSGAQDDASTVSSVSAAHSNASRHDRGAGAGPDGTDREDDGEDDGDGEADWDFEEELLAGLAEDQEGDGQQEGEDGGDDTGAWAGEEAEEHEAGSKGPSVASGTAKGEGSASVHSKLGAGRPVKERPLRIDWDAVLPYLFCGSAVASLFQACLHAEHPRAFQQAVIHAQIACTGDAVPGTVLLLPGLDLQYLLPPAPSIFADGAADSEGAPGGYSVHSATSLQPSPDSVSYPVRELQAKGVAAFLADVMVAPQRSAKKCALPWATWQEVLQLLAAGLKTDFDALQAWR
jgi:hypothetical protein